MDKSVLGGFLTNSGFSPYVSFGIVLAVLLLAVTALKYFVSNHLKKWAGKTDTKLDDFLVGSAEKHIIPFLYFGALYLSAQCVIVSASLVKFLRIFGVGALTFFATRFVISVAAHAVNTYLLNGKIDRSKAKAVKGLMPALKVLIWAIAVIFLLDNLGFKISTIVAGLGIGGVAVALAAQAVLGDLFSYFCILLDRPFEQGDFIITGDMMGTVEHIGVKTTRIRSLGGEEIVMANSDLTGARVRNYKRMERRRIVFALGATYQTPSGKLKEIPDIIKTIIKSTDGTEFDRAHFSSYGDSALMFEIVYYVLSADYNKYMDIQQKINFAIKEEFEKQGIEFAYPTQTLYLKKE